MIEEARGNLLEADVEALVNTVNTVGVMGKGIALQFKRAFPENFKQYQAACKKGLVRIGEMLVHETGAIDGPRYIVNFPTKTHWKSRSKLADVEAGLSDLRRVIVDMKFESIAVPPLGCGNGGLEWSDVYPLIKDSLGDLDDVRILVYVPSGAPDPQAMPVRTKRPSMTAARAALLLAFERYIQQSVEAGQSDDNKLSIVEAQKIAYFLQISGWGSWEFSPSYFGPYAHTVDQFISFVEGHFIFGYGDGSAGSKATLSLDREALKEAHSILDSSADFQKALHRFEVIVNGFEFPYGIELLSTVHYVVEQQGVNTSIDDVISAINAWSARKGRLFKRKQADLAYRHLVSVQAVDTGV